MVSPSTPSANEPTKDLILAHTVQLKSMIKVHFPGRMVSSGISDVAIALVHYEKTHLKKLINIRECGSTLYVGLARTVPPTNTNFHLSILLIRLQEAVYEDLPV